MAVQKLSKPQPVTPAVDLSWHESNVIQHKARLDAITFLLSQSVSGPHEWDSSIFTALSEMIEESVRAMDSSFDAVFLALARHLKGAANG